MSRPWTFRRFAIAGAFILAAWLASSLLRHSLIADDEGPSEAPQVETPPSATPPPAIPSLSIPPVPTGSGVVSDPTRDPLFQEFRRLVSDPANGLSVPSLSIRSPLEATLAEGVSQLRENRQRLKCIEKLTDAATALLEDAEILMGSKQPDKAVELMQSAMEIRKMIARLAAP